MQKLYHASERMGPFVWAAFARAREAAAGTLASAFEAARGASTTGRFQIEILSRTRVPAINE